MAVRAEAARAEPDGSLPEVPAYVYDLGPDGRPYAADVPKPARPEAQTDEPPDDEAPEPVRARPTDDRDTHAVTERAPTPTAGERTEERPIEARAGPQDNAQASPTATRDTRELDARRQELEQAYHPPAMTNSHFDLVV